MRDRPVTAWVIWMPWLAMIVTRWASAATSGIPKIAWTLVVQSSGVNSTTVQRIIFFIGQLLVRKNPDSLRVPGVSTTAPSSAALRPCGRLAPPAAPRWQ